MRFWSLLGLLVLLSSGSNMAAAQSPSDDAIGWLAQQTVSRLEWGIEKLRRALMETLSIDPLTLQPSSPPFFVNVSYQSNDKRILIEIGRTFASVGNDRAKELCTEYIARVRGLLSVDPLGRPSVGGASSLAEDYFQPIDPARIANGGLAEDLDRSVFLRVLVASPLNGVFSICTASLIGSPVRHVE